MLHSRRDKRDELLERLCLQEQIAILPLEAPVEGFHRGLGIDFISYTENIDTTGAMGKLVFTIFAGIAEFERSLIVQRIKAGLDRVRAGGHTLGKAPLDPTVVAEIRRLRGRGLSVRATAAKVKQSKSVVSKYANGRGGASWSRRPHR